MSINRNDLLIDVLTRKRLTSYLEACDQNDSRALELYKWNAELAAAFFYLLGIVEVVVRNSIDREMQTFNVTLGNQGEWFDDLTDRIDDDSNFKVRKIKARLVSNRRSLSHGNIMSELDFGFWRSFLSRKYKDTLWRTALRFAFPHAPSRQPEYIFARVRHLHVLRNRIAHHEPIHRRDIASDFQICIEVLDAISPVIAQWSADNFRVLAVLAQKPT